MEKINEVWHQTSSRRCGIINTIERTFNHSN
jgi:hypothetical protein